jgi:hypothetical protein
MSKVRKEKRNIKVEFERDILNLLKKYKMWTDNGKVAIKNIEIKCNSEDLPEIKIESFIKEYPLKLTEK